MPTYTHESELDHPVERVFDWHLRPGAFERLTPPWANVRVLERVGGIEDGGRVKLRIKPAGPISVEWTLVHSGYERNRRFQDEQVDGPFVHWLHRHLFEARNGGGTLYRDEVDWEIPTGGIARTLGGGTVLKRELRKLFRFRHERLRLDLDRHAAYPGPLLTVAVTGASGLVGHALRHFLTTGGHRVVRLVRREPQGADERRWDPGADRLEAEIFDGCDAVVHLAGEPIEGRWTSAKKRAILDSRVESTRLIANTLIDMKGPRPKTLIVASAIGYYGDRGKQILDETAEAGKGFLSRVTQDWEAASRRVQAVGVRVVNLRFGVVLTARGGALSKLLVPFKMGVGGRLGSGRQYMSWIGMDDAIGLVLHALRTPSVRGPLNVVAPQAIPNAAFTDTLGRVLGRPTLLPVPGFAIRALLGEMGQEALLAGARVQPAKAEASGFRFAHPDLESALRFQLGGEPA